ncbi:hypothetical protein CF328_g8746 [Tilletia controversa]|nr:hypothetical protein CF328_g8746 [Tilletia controversa]
MRRSATARETGPIATILINVIQRGDPSWLGLRRSATTASRTTRGGSMGAFRPPAIDAVGAIYRRPIIRALPMPHTYV